MKNAIFIEDDVYLELDAKAAIAKCLTTQLWICSNPVAPKQPIGPFYSPQYFMGYENPKSIEIQIAHLYSNKQFLYIKLPTVHISGVRMVNIPNSGKQPLIPPDWELVSITHRCGKTFSAHSAANYKWELAYDSEEREDHEIVSYTVRKSAPKEDSNKFDSDGIMVFDFDGVVSIGLCPPAKNAIIVTGRGYDECDIVYDRLKDLTGRLVPVYFNPFTADNGRTRVRSGIHKANIIKMFIEAGVKVQVVFEDDDEQIDEIKRALSDSCPRICKIDSYWVKK